MTRLKNKKPIHPLAFSYYFFAVVLIALVGLGDAVYLAISHYRVYMDIGYQSFCTISRSLNCDTVSQSRWAILLNVPVSVWAIWGYGFFLALLSFAWSKKELGKRMWTFLFLIALCFTLYSFFLAFVSTYRIKSYCVMCILSYAVNLFLLYFSWLIRRRFHCEPVFKSFFLDIRHLLSHPKITGSLLILFGTIAVLLIFYFPAYWQYSPPGISSEIFTGTTQDGHPWIGAQEPELVIEEFSDYLCFQCKKMHFFLRRMIQVYPDKIRLIHRHFPMDHAINPVVKEPFHEGSASLALFSLYLAEKGKFWEINDILFNIPRHENTINLQDLAQQAGITLEDLNPVFQDQNLWVRLQQDIQAGIVYNLKGTPAFIIDGKAYEGQIPAEVFHNHGIMKTKK
ncbi:MAG: thioredoxin domain-containing protein [Desulfobacteraceae bacterium]|nr:thioredoxin domain-containing protein [Desulfobacteraceae bacterium]